LSKTQRQYDDDDDGDGSESVISFEPFTLGQDCPIKLARFLHSTNTETVYSLATPDVQHETVSDFELTNVTGIQDLVGSCKMAGIQKVKFRIVDGSYEPFQGHDQGR